MQESAGYHFICQAVAQSRTKSILSEVNNILRVAQIDARVIAWPILHRGLILCGAGVSFVCLQKSIIQSKTLSSSGQILGNLRLVSFDRSGQSL